MSNQKIAYTQYFETNAELAAFLAKLDGAADGAKTTKAETSKAETTKPAAKAASKPKVTKEQMQAALTEVKDTLGVPDAKALITEVGGVKKMDDIPEDKFEAVLKAAQEKLAEAEAGGGDDDSGI